jgi:DNA-binding MarR family transcriptional regulator
MKKEPAETREDQRAAQTLESLPLGELFSYWSDLLWLNAMRPMLEGMMQLELSLPQNLVLRQLRCQSMTIAEVAAYLSITHSAASRIIDRLVRAGLLSRVENPEDRRQKLLALTPEGAALMQNIERKFTAGIESMTAHLSTDEQVEFRRLIARMVATQLAEGEAAVTKEGPPRPPANKLASTASDQ